MTKVLIWTKPACVQCSATKRFFDKAGVEYEERNLMDNLDKVEEFRQKGITSAPVTEATGFDPIPGYDDVALREVAESHGLVQ